MPPQIDFYQRSMHEANQDRLTDLEKGQVKLREDVATFKAEVKANSRWIGVILAMFQILLEYLTHHK